MDEDVAKHDFDSARGWRELAAGLVARWEQLKRAKGYTAAGMIVDTVLAFNAAKGVPIRETADALGSSQGSLKVRLGRLRRVGAERIGGGSTY
jgi:hypothetical protein